VQYLFVQLFLKISLIDGIIDGHSDQEVTALRMAVHQL